MYFIDLYIQNEFIDSSSSEIYKQSAYPYLCTERLIVRFTVANHYDLGCSAKPCYDLSRAVK